MWSSILLVLIGLLFGFNQAKFPANERDAKAIYSVLEKYALSHIKDALDKEKEMSCKECKALEKDIEIALGLVFLDPKPVIKAICHDMSANSTLPFEVCLTIVEKFLPGAKKSYNKVMLGKSGFICSYMTERCPNNETQVHRYDLKPIIESIYKDMPPVKNRTAPSGKTYKMLQINDMHVDWEYSPGGIANCENGIMCCREGKKVIPGEEPVYAGFWGQAGRDEYVCDIPPHTLDKFFQFARELDPDYIIWLGDNEYHEIDTVSEKVNINTTEYMANALAANFPKAKIFVSIGNHENHPIDNLDFTKPLNNLWFFDGLVSRYRPLLEDDELKQMKSKGYYTTYVESQNLRVISLFTSGYDDLNLFLIDRTFDIDGQLSWVRQTLDNAEKKQEDVIIIMHIPVGDSFSIGGWDDVMNALVERYRNTIKGLFSAHTHNDHLKFHRARGDNQKVVKTQYIGPSLTTFTNLNPSFRMYTMDKVSNEVLDYTQYRLNLTKYNQEGEFADLKWDVAYTLLKEYNLADTSEASMQKLYDTFNQDYTTMETYTSNFYTGNYNVSQWPDASQGIKLKCGLYSNSGDFLKCMGFLAMAVDPEDYGPLVLGNLLPGFLTVN